MENDKGEFDHFETEPNGHEDQEEIDEESVEKEDNLEYEDCLEAHAVEDEGNNQDIEETTETDMDLSLLHDEDGVDDSDVDKSNDDSEAIKLLNEDDDAFESFLHTDDGFHLRSLVY